MRSCTYDDCRSALAEHARFCPRCGRPVVGAEEPAPASVWPGLIVIGLFAAVLVPFALFHGGSPSRFTSPVVRTPTPFDSPTVVLGPAIAEHFRVAGTRFQPSFDGSGVQGMVTLSLEPLPGAPSNWPHRLIRVGDLQDAGRAVACELPPPDRSGTVSVTCAVLSAAQRRRLDVEYVRPESGVKAATGRGF